MSTSSRVRTPADVPRDPSTTQSARTSRAPCRCRSPPARAPRQPWRPVRARPHGQARKNDRPAGRRWALVGPRCAVGVRGTVPRRAGRCGAGSQPWAPRVIAPAPGPRVLQFSRTLALSLPKTVDDCIGIRSVMPSWPCATVVRTRPARDDESGAIIMVSHRSKVVRALSSRQPGSGETAEGRRPARYLQQRRWLQYDTETVT